MGLPGKTGAGAGAGIGTEWYGVGVRLDMGTIPLLLTVLLAVLELE